MKIRTGFVSNSSSSSFCLYGAYLDRNKVEKLMNPDEQDDYDYYTGYEELAKRLDLECENGPCPEDGAYFGVSPSKFPDDKTVADIKKEIQEKINRVFPETKCSFHEEGWYNG